MYMYNRYFNIFSPFIAMIPMTRTTSDQIPPSSLPISDHAPRFISSPVQPRKVTPDAVPPSPKLNPLRTFSIPVFPETDTSEKKLYFSERVKVRSNSDANILCQGLEEEEEDDTLGSLKRRSQSIDDVLSGDEKEASLETASKKIEALLGERKVKTSSKPLLSLWTNLRKDSKERKKLRQRAPSINDEQSEECLSRSGSTTPVDCQSADNSPFTSRKKKQSLQKKLKKARNSLYLFQHSEKVEERGERGGGGGGGEEEGSEGRGSVEGCVSTERSSISSGDQPLDIK